MRILGDIYWIQFYQEKRANWRLDKLNLSEKSKDRMNCIKIQKIQLAINLTFVCHAQNIYYRIYFIIIINFFSVGNIIKKLMQHSTQNFYFGNDSQNTFLSLQLLDELGTEQKCTQPQIKPSHKYQTLQDYLNNYGKSSSIELNNVELSKQNIQSSLNTDVISESKVSGKDNFRIMPECGVRQSVGETKTEYEISSLNNLRRAVSMTEDNSLDMLKNLEQSGISRQTSKGPSDQLREGQSESIPHQQLAILRELREQAFANLNSSQHAQQVKQNFQILFQKVYGIIQQIQERHQKIQMKKSTMSSARRQLSLNTRVIQLNVGKDNDKIKKKKFCNVQTQVDYQMQAIDEDIDQNTHIKTQQWAERTPCPSASRMKQNNLLSLSKQFPCLATPKAGLNSARSDRSSRSKGITLVSVQKQRQVQSKKPAKITLVQKKIVMCLKNKAEAYRQKKPAQHKPQKKTSAFSANNFFNSRRVSSRVI